MSLHTGASSARHSVTVAGYYWMYYFIIMLLSVVQILLTVPGNINQHHMFGAPKPLGLASFLASFSMDSAIIRSGFDICFAMVRMGISSWTHHRLCAVVCTRFTLLRNQWSSISALRLTFLTEQFKLHTIFRSCKNSFTFTVSHSHLDSQSSPQKTTTTPTHPTLPPLSPAEP